MRVIGASSTAFILVSALLVAAAAPARATEDLNRIILRVNGKILTLHDYEKRKAVEITRVLANSSLDAEARQERLSQLGKQIVKQSFQELLVLSRAEQLGIRVDDAQIDAALREMRESQGIHSEEELITALEAYGMTLDEMRDNLRRDLTMQQTIARTVNPRVAIEDDDVRAAYRSRADEFRVPEKRRLLEVIVLEASDLDEAARRLLAAEIHAELEAGGAFEAVVEPHRAAGHTSGVIDLSWLSADELEPALAKAAWTLEPGDYSSPVEARGGYHILRVEEIEEATIRAFEEVEAEIRSDEHSRRFAQEIRTFMKELEETAFIEENLPAEAVGYRALADIYEDEPDELERFRAPLESRSQEEPTDG